MAKELCNILADLNEINESLRKLGPKRREQYTDNVNKKIANANILYESVQNIIQSKSLEKLDSKTTKLIDDVVRKIEIVYDKICTYSSSACNLEISVGNKVSKMETFDIKTAASLVPVMDSREESVEKIIDAVELYASCLKDANCKKLLVSFVLKTRLTKSAKLKLKKEYQSISSLVDDMRKFLLTQKSSNSLMTQLNNISQDNMSIAQYASKIEELMVDLTISQAGSNEAASEILRPINEQMAVKKFADGLRNRRLSTIISARNYSELKDAVRAAQDEEQSQPLPSTSNSVLSYRGKSFRYPYRGQAGPNHKTYHGNSNYNRANYSNYSRVNFNNNYRQQGRQTRGASTRSSRGRATRGRGYYYNRNINFAQHEQQNRGVEEQQNTQNNNSFFRA